MIRGSQGAWTAGGGLAGVELMLAELLRLALSGVGDDSRPGRIGSSQGTGSGQPGGGGQMGGQRQLRQEQQNRGREVAGAGISPNAAGTDRRSDSQPNTINYISNTYNIHIGQISANTNYGDNSMNGSNFGNYGSNGNSGSHSTYENQGNNGNNGNTLGTLLPKYDGGRQVNA